MQRYKCTYANANANPNARLQIKYTNANTKYQIPMPLPTAHTNNFTTPSTPLPQHHSLTQQPTNQPPKKIVTNKIVHKQNTNRQICGQNQTKQTNKLTHRNM